MPLHMVDTVLINNKDIKNREGKEFISNVEIREFIILLGRCRLIEKCHSHQPATQGLNSNLKNTLF